MAHIIGYEETVVYRTSEKFYQMQMNLVKPCWANPWSFFGLAVFLEDFPCFRLHSCFILQSPQHAAILENLNNGDSLLRNAGKIVDVLEKKRLYDFYNLLQT